MAQDVERTGAQNLAPGVLPMRSSPERDDEFIRWGVMVRLRGEARMKPTANTYEIQIREYLDSHWADWLGGMALTHTDDGGVPVRFAWLTAA